MSMAFILCKLLFHKTIDAKFIVRGLCNPELTVVDMVDGRLATDVSARPFFKGERFGQI